jgi:hypothetical protein
MRRTMGLAVLVAALGAVPDAALAQEKLAPATRREMARAVNNMKQIGLAFHAFHDTTGSFPTDIKDKDGKALLSWRVAILPYIEQDQLYKLFKLNEPWDSANNKPLIAKMPEIYAPIRVKGKEGETFYQTVTGPNTLFDGKTRRTFVNITDGTSNTGMVFQAAEAVTWSKPADMVLDAKKPLKLGGMFDGESHVTMGDGSVKTLKKDPDANELKKLINPADGNVIDFKKLEK